MENSGKLFYGNTIVQDTDNILKVDLSILFELLLNNDIDSCNTQIQKIISLIYSDTHLNKNKSLQM